MTSDHNDDNDQNQTLYDAFAGREARFDGVYFMGVSSTGIYCRPVCPAKTPRVANCAFFGSAASAEKAGYRPCLRCRPELAPGNAPVDGPARIAARIAERIGDGLLDEGGGLERIAAEFHFSSRQIRRIVKNELGVSPIELVQTRRLLLAKQLLTETSMSVTSVAYASGFGSLRRFNDAFMRRYGMAPTRLRRAAASDAPSPNEANATAETLTLQLAYRPPYDWPGMLGFLRGRAMKGVEWVTADAYHRTVQIGVHSGWLRVGHARTGNALVVELPFSLTPVLPVLLSRIRDVFDLRARPDLIAAKLGEDPLLRAAVAANPGLRVPGAFDGFEMAVRAVLGQQVTVQGAATLAGRFVEAFGDVVATPFEGLDRATPTAERIALTDIDTIASLGIISARARCIISLAREVTAGRLHLRSGAHADDVIRQLVLMPGIGPWTANYIAMRALRWPDAFPKEDIVLRKRLGGVTAVQAEALSQAWRPWRSYATLHLWNMPEQAAAD